MKKQKDYIWLLLLIVLAIAVLASSCSIPQTKYKGHLVGSSITRIEPAEPDYEVGDTILIQSNSYQVRFVIESIVGVTVDLDCKSLAGVSVRDSIAFETAAESVTWIDFPEELPVTGDSMCAYIISDTMYMEHYHNTKYQQDMYRFVYNQ